DLGELEIFGENLYAIHSIEYTDLAEHFYVFAIRYKDVWLSWEEVEFIAAFYDFPTAPLLLEETPSSETEIKKTVIDLAVGKSLYDSVDAHTGEGCTMEGIVSRNKEEYPVADFKQNVFKYVRANHVQTDEHWTRNWKRAPLVWEKKK
ncbi:MAG: RNA ligase family protein, partial [Saprospiraceae bacterium]